jgi:hypothetical protein
MVKESSGSVPSPSRAAGAVRYLAHIDSVEGWLVTTAAIAMIELLWYQEELGKSGGVAEIGIYHGKSFLALVAAARPEDPLFAIDLFEKQHLNVDGSGTGDRQIFLANLARFFPAANVTAVAESSQDLWGLQDELHLNDLRFMSIDGGHTSELTLNDLRFADRALSSDGVCLLDDVLNPHWTGVLTGLFEFLRSGGDLVPIALVPNKLVLVRSGRRESYLRSLRHLLSYALDRKEREFGDSLIDIYGDRPLAAWPRAAGLLEVDSATSVANRDPADRGHRDNTALPRVETVKAERDALQRQVDIMRESTSWRLTAPFRRAGSAARLAIRRLSR